MIEQLMNECQNLAILAGFRDDYYVRVDVIPGPKRRFQASFFGDYKSIEDQPEEALRSLKAKLMLRVENKLKETQSIMETHHQQLRKMEAALQTSEVINVSQISP